MDCKTLKELENHRPARNIIRMQREILKDIAYTTDLEHYVTDIKPLLVQDQRNVYNIIMNRVNGVTGGLFFIGAPEGT